MRYRPRTIALTAIVATIAAIPVFLQVNAIGAIIDQSPAPRAAAATALSYTRDGYTIRFDVDCTGGCLTGTFADNWSKWVAPSSPNGSVTITGISPAQTGTGRGFRNGAMRDPAGGSHAFTGEASSYNGSFNETLKLNLPAVINPSTLGRPSVIVKSVSKKTAGCPNRQCNAYFETLTVVARDPGRTFRPPWFGTVKPLIPAGDFRPEILPSLAPQKGVMSWDSALATMQSPFLQTLVHEWVGHQGLIAEVNQQTTAGYDSYAAQGIGGALTRLVTSASGADVQKKQQLALYTAQRAIDLYYRATVPYPGQGANVGCAQWISTGGYNTGRLFPLMVGAYLLRKTEWLDWLNKLHSTHDGRHCFAESGTVVANETKRGKGVPTFGNLNSALYSYACTKGGNQNCASTGTGMTGNLANYDGLADGNPYAAGEVQKYPPPYMNIMTGTMFGPGLVILLTPSMHSAIPPNLRYMFDYLERVKSAGDRDGVNSMGFYNNVRNSNVGYIKLSYIAPGATAMWTAYKSCYRNHTCAGQ